MKDVSPGHTGIVVNHWPPPLLCWLPFALFQICPRCQSLTIFPLSSKSRRADHRMNSAFPLPCTLAAANDHSLRPELSIEEILHVLKHFVRGALPPTRIGLPADFLASKVSMRPKVPLADGSCPGGFRLSNQRPLPNFVFLRDSALDKYMEEANLSFIRSQPYRKRSSACASQKASRGREAEGLFILASCDVDGD